MLREMRGVSSVRGLRIGEVERSGSGRQRQGASTRHRGNVASREDRTPLTMSVSPFWTRRYGLLCMGRKRGIYIAREKDDTGSKEGFSSRMG